MWHKTVRDCIYSSGTERVIREACKPFVLHQQKGKQWGCFDTSQMEEVFGLHQEQTAAIAN